MSLRLNRRLVISVAPAMSAVVGRRILAAALALVVAGASAACRQDESTPTPTAAPPFRIGVMESVTGPGETYGTVMVQARQMAADEINAVGGVDGRKLELIIEDSKCASQDAITAYRKLAGIDGVKIILGASCSGATLGAAPLAEADRVVLFSASSTNPDIATAGDYIFRTAINDNKRGVDTANVIWADGVRRLATIAESTDYAEGLRRITEQRFESLGGEVVAAEGYASDSADFRAQLTKILAADPDAIHLAAQSEFTGGAVIKQARELGYAGPLYTETAGSGSTALEIAGEAATGVKAIIPSPDLATAIGKDFLRRFRERYGHITLPWYLGSAYDGVHIAAECLRQTGDDQDADGFRDCLYAITHSGAIGDGYGFDEQGEVVGLSYATVEILPVAERTDENLGYRVLGSRAGQ